MKTLIYLVVLTFGLSGCGPKINYVYTTPKSSEGLVCIAQCQNSEQMCWSYNQNTYQQCLNNHYWEMQNYNQCRSNGKTNEEKNRCYMPPACYGPNNYYCDQGYRACYQSCGGTVQAFEVKDD